MNYLKELNAFYDRLETNPLSTSAIALWHALMHINNKAGWINEFSVAVSVLCSKTGVSERTVSKARNELKEKGYITFTSRQGNQAAVYQLLSLVFRLTTYNSSDSSSGNRADNSTGNDAGIHVNTVDTTDKHAGKDSGRHSDKEAGNHAEISQTETITGKSADTCSDLDSGSCANNRTALSKRNKTKRNETITNQVSLYDSFQKSFNKIPTPMQIDILTSFIDQDGLTEGLVVYGLSIAGEKGKPFSYAKSILSNWCKDHIRTVEEAKAVGEEYRASNNNITKFPMRGGNVGEQYPKRNHDRTNKITNFKFYK